VADEKMAMVVREHSDCFIERGYGASTI